MELLINDFSRSTTSDVHKCRVLRHHDKLKYDLDDYRASNVIGEFANNACCEVWNDMANTKRATFEAWRKALTELLLNTISITDCKMQRLEYIQKMHKNFWEVCYLNYFKTQLVFWNHMICQGDQVEGVLSSEILYDIGESWHGSNVFPGPSRYITVPYTVDFGASTNTFNASLWAANEQAYKDMICCLRKYLGVLNGFTFERGLPPGSTTLDVADWPTQYPDII